MFFKKKRGKKGKKNKGSFQKQKKSTMSKEQIKSITDSILYKKRLFVYTE